MFVNVGLRILTLALSETVVTLMKITVVNDRF